MHNRHVDVGSRIFHLAIISLSIIDSQAHLFLLSQEDPDLHSLKKDLPDYVGRAEVAVGRKGLGGGLRGGCILIFHA